MFRVLLTHELVSDAEIFGVTVAVVYKMETNADSKHIFYFVFPGANVEHVLKVGHTREIQSNTNKQ